MRISACPLDAVNLEPFWQLKQRWRDISLSAYLDVQHLWRIEGLAASKFFLSTGCMHGSIAQTNCELCCQGSGDARLARYSLRDDFFIGLRLGVLLYIPPSCLLASRWHCFRWSSSSPQPLQGNDNRTVVALSCIHLTNIKDSIRLCTSHTYTISHGCITRQVW
jgi:hypothetical protein